MFSLFKEQQRGRCRVSEEISGNVRRSQAMCWALSVMVRNQDFFFPANGGFWIGE